METRTASFIGDQGIKLAADVMGTPLRGAILFAHGGGQTRHAWAEAGARVAGLGWQAILLDLRGHGESAWAESGDYRLQRFAADLVLASEQLERRPHLVGASLGGLAGLFAETHVRAEAFNSLTLVDITPNMEPAGVAKIMGFMSERLQQGFASVEEAADIIANYLPHRPRPKDLSGLAKNLRLSPDGRYRWHWDPRFVSSVMASRREAPIEAMMATVGELRVPVHLIRGRMSELVSAESAKAFLASVPSAKFTDIADAGHMIAGDQNDAFIDAVASFINSLR